MNFRKRQHQEPEINLIPFIDVLLVILIFLMLSTTYTKFTEVQLQLPVADTEAQKNYPDEVIVKISSEGGYWINEEAQTGRSVEFLGGALQTAAKGNKNAVIIISATVGAAWALWRRDPCSLWAALSRPSQPTTQPAQAGFFTPGETHDA